MYKVSVIIPIYNTSKYLVECLESVIHQSMNDIEIICVDDGSTDESGRIIDEYAIRYPLVRVIHKDNSGYGDSVNRGIDLAKGEYIGIVEPDDYISAEMYERLYAKANEFDLDWVKGNYICFWDNDNSRKEEYRKVIELEEYYSRIINPSVDTQIFKSNIINPAGIYKKAFLDRCKIRHNITPGASYQDLGFWYQIMTNSAKGLLLDDAFYYYRQDNSDSSMNNCGKIFCVCDEYDFLQKKLPQKPNGVLTQCMYTTYYFTYYQRLAVEYRKEFLERFRSDFIALKNKNLYEDSLLLRENIIDLNFLLEDMNGYYDNSMKLSKQIVGKLDGINEFIIYGAGNFAQRIFHEMTVDLRNRLVGFVVTSDEHDNKLLGKNIYSVNELANKRYDVVIGVTSKYRDEIMNILANYKTKSLIVIDEEE